MGPFNVPKCLVTKIILAGKQINFGSSGANHLRRDGVLSLLLLFDKYCYLFSSNVT